MFEPVTALDFEQANTHLDIAEAVLKRLESQSGIQANIKRWHWDTPCATLFWASDGVERNVTVVLVDLTPTFNIEGGAWVDDQALKLRRWTYHPHPGTLTTLSLEQEVSDLFERIKKIASSELTKLARLT